MNNRFFGQAYSDLPKPSPNYPLEFSRQQYHRLSVAIDGLMMELEQRYAHEKGAVISDRNRFSPALRTTDVVPALGTFDDFGLVRGLEIDVRWM